MWGLWLAWRIVGVVCQEKGSSSVQFHVCLLVELGIEKVRRRKLRLRRVIHFPKVAISRHNWDLGSGTCGLIFFTPSPPHLSSPRRSSLESPICVGITGGQGAFAYNLPIPVQMFRVCSLHICQSGFNQGSRSIISYGRRELL